jgi:hypothetical protein
VKGKQIHFILAVQTKFISSEGSGGIISKSQCAGLGPLLLHLSSRLMLFILFMHLAGFI